MRHPDQWRKTIDPFSLPYQSFHPIEILGYPHAGNDVFHARGIYDGREVRAYIKAARQNGAAIENEVAILSSLGLKEYKDIFANPPKEFVRSFCHGDFHYANILWKDHHISGILDFELAGIGNRDFDIAWAMFRRPGQKFMKTEAEQEAFLLGYQKIAPCDPDVIHFYMAQCYVNFLKFSGDDPEYCDYIRGWLKRQL